MRIPIRDRSELAALRLREEVGSYRHLVIDWKEDRIGSALRGENPTVLAQMPGGFAVMSDVQWLPGYCVLLTDDPTGQKALTLGDSQALGQPSRYGTHSAPRANRLGHAPQRP